MTTENTHHSSGRRIASDVGLLLLRLPIGVVFVLAGWMKIHSMGVGEFVTQASGAIPSYMPHALGKAYLYAVPWAELIVGVCLLLGVLTRIIGAITALMLLSFMMAVTGFTDKGSIHFSLAYMCVALALVLLGPGRISADALITRVVRRKKPR
jgi:uncharacterized membrane protein YphA (DoxX/SURF4 family)